MFIPQNLWLMEIIGLDPFKIGKLPHVVITKNYHVGMIFFSNNYSTNHLVYASGSFTGPQNWGGVGWGC